MALVTLPHLCLEISLARGLVMSEHEPFVLLQEGTWGRMLAVKMPDGSSPAYEWLVALDDRGQGAMRARLERLAEVGTQKTPENFRRLSDDGRPVVFEVKHTGQNLRLYVIKERRIYWATHGGLKPKKNQVSREVQRARRLYETRMR